MPSSQGSFFSLFLMGQIVLVMAVSRTAIPSELHEGAEESAFSTEPSESDSETSIPEAFPKKETKPATPKKRVPYQREFHFTEEDTLYKMIQKNLDAAQNLRELMETGKKKPGANYNYWEYHKSRNGGYYSQVDPRVLGHKMNPQEHLNGALKELESRINELKSHNNVAPEDAMLVSKVIEEVEDVLGPGLKRVEDAVFKSGIVVPHRGTPRERIKNEPQQNNKEKSDQDDLDKYGGLLHYDKKEKTISPKDYSKVKQADSYFAELKKSLGKIELIDQKMAELSPQSFESKRLAKERKSKCSEFLRIYSDFSNLKDYYSYQTASDLPAFEPKFKKISDEKEAPDGAKKEVPARVPEDSKSQAKAKARAEIDTLRKQIINSISSKNSVGKTAEAQFNEALERLKHLESALDLSDNIEDQEPSSVAQASPANTVKQDGDSRWLASLESPRESGGGASKTSDDPKKGSPVSSPPEKTREEKRGFVDSLTKGAIISDNRLSTLDAQETLNFRKSTASQEPSLSKGVESIPTEPGGFNNPERFSSEARFQGADSKNRMGKTEFKAREVSDSNDEKEKSNLSAPPSWLSSVIQGMVSGLSPQNRNGSSSLLGNPQEKNKTTQNSVTSEFSDSKKNIDGLLENGESQVMDGESGVSLRDPNRKKRRGESERAAKSISEQESSLGSVNNYFSSNTTYSQTSLVTAPEPIAKSKRAEEKYQRNPDGTWSPVNGKDFKTRKNVKTDGMGTEEGLQTNGDLPLSEISEIAGTADNDSLLNTQIEEETSQSQFSGLLDELGLRPTVDSLTSFLKQISEESPVPKRTDLSDKIARTGDKKKLKPALKVQSEPLTEGVMRSSSKTSLLETFRVWLGLN